jgi:hypothetical protein
MERALSGKATNDIDIVLYNAVSRENETWSGRPLLDQDNNVIAAVVTLRDISKYKQLEQELKKQKKIQKINRL